MVIKEKMMAVTRIDPVELLNRCYEAAFNAELWPAALDLIANGFNARGALLPTEKFIPGTLPCSGAMKDVLAQFFEQHWHEHDQRTIAARRLISSTDYVADQDLFSPEEIDRSQYYHGFARSAGVPWFCAVTLSMASPDSYVALSLQRTNTQGMFEDSEREALLSLLPHLRNAAYFATKLAGQQHTALIQAFDSIGMAAAIIDRHGRIIALNGHFDQLNHPALVIRNNRMEATSSASRHELSKLLSGLNENTFQVGTLTGPIALRCEAATLPLILRAAPLRFSASNPFQTQATLITVSNPMAALNISVQTLEVVFDLTRREAEVMALLIVGHDLQTIARSLNVSREGIRFHLKSIFSKTGTNRQSALVSLGLRCARNSVA